MVSTFASSGQNDLFQNVETALNAGDIHRADSLHTLAGPVNRNPGVKHEARILDARLAASRGDWKSTDAILRAWRNSTERREGSGEILFWMGWSAMHQARLTEADSLLVLASAYSDEERSQDALEYRFAGLLDPGPHLQDYLRGLPESPLPHPLRVASLDRVPQNSRIFPYSRWHLAVLLESRGDTARSRPLLDTLARNTRHAIGRRAAAYQALLTEQAAPDTALKAYEKILMDGQQGVTAEFARKRAHKLRPRR